MTAIPFAYNGRFRRVSRGQDPKGERRYTLLREALVDHEPVIITYRDYRKTRQTHLFFVVSLGPWERVETECGLSVLGCRTPNGLSPCVYATIREMLEVVYLRRPQYEGGSVW